MRPTQGELKVRKEQKIEISKEITKIINKINLKSKESEILSNLQSQMDNLENISEIYIIMKNEVDKNLPKLNDDAGISINIKWLIQIVILVGSAVLLYTHLEGRITDTENEIQGLRYNQNNYVFPDIRVLEGEILEVKLERERVRKDLKRINEIIEK